MTRASRERPVARPRSLIVLVLTAISIVVLGIAPGAARAKNNLSVSSTVNGVSLKKATSLSGSVVWSASPAGSAVSKVAFLIDDVPRWTESSAPYRFHGDPTGVLDTTTLSNGNHRFTAVAYSTTGQTALTRAWVKVLNRLQPTPFTVTSSIGNGSTISGRLTWSAVPQGATVESIEFFVDGVSRWTEALAPYQFNGDPNGALDTTALDNGGHTLAVLARAVDGRTATARLSVRVANRPASSNGQQTYPDAPRDLHITDSSQQTSLTAAWTAVRGASGYRVGRDGMALTDTDRTTYTWPGLTCATAYTLSVQPEKSARETNGRVATVTATTAACPAPPAAVPPAPPPPPPPPPPVPPPVAFRGDFETANIAPWQATTWGGAQCVNYGVPSGVGTLHVVDDTVAKGSYSARFDLPAADTSNSCELLRGRTIAMDDEWYSMEIRLPSDWQEPSPTGWGLELAQFNFQSIWGTPVGVVAHSNYVDLILNAGLCSPAKSGNPSCQYSSGIGGNLPRQHVIPTSAFSTGSWHQLLIHVKWTNGNDGVVEGFHRLRGETTWTRTATLAGYPTLQRTTDYTPVASDQTVDKIGAYRGKASFPLSIWQDNFCQATSMAAAERCF